MTRSPDNRINAAVRRHIPHCRSLSAWLLRCKGSYRPTLRADLMGAQDQTLLADAFDAAMAAAGDPRRAHRSGVAQ